MKDYVAESRTAVIYEKPWSTIKCHYVWRPTDRWINFPWSSTDPVVPAVPVTYRPRASVRECPGLERVIRKRRMSSSRQDIGEAVEHCRLDRDHLREDDHHRSGITLVDWWATWCGPCRAFGPVFEAASEKDPDMTFGKIDTDATRTRREVPLLLDPTLMAFRDGCSCSPAGRAARGGEQVIKAVRDLDMDDVRAQMAHDHHDTRATTTTVTTTTEALGLRRPTSPRRAPTAAVLDWAASGGMALTGRPDRPPLAAAAGAFGLLQQVTDELAAVTRAVGREVSADPAELIAGRAALASRPRALAGLCAAPGMICTGPARRGSASPGTAARAGPGGLR